MPNDMLEMSLFDYNLKLFIQSIYISINTTSSIQACETLYQMLSKNPTVLLMTYSIESHLKSKKIHHWT